MPASPVQLYIYDLSGGLARSLSLSYLGTTLDGIWHTSLVAFGREFFFGAGLQFCAPGGSQHGSPVKIERLGETERTEAEFNTWLSGQMQNFSAESYHLLSHNCNDFTLQASLFLTGNPIPAYISELPAQFLATPFGASMRPMIDSMFRAGHNPQAGESVAELVRDLQVQKALAKLPELQRRGPSRFESRPNLQAAGERFDLAQVSVSQRARVQEVVRFLHGAEDAARLDLSAIVADVVPGFPSTALFPLYDLIRASLCQPGTSLSPEAVTTLLASVLDASNAEDSEARLKPLLLSSLRMVCNLLPHITPVHLPELVELVESVATSKIQSVTTTLAVLCVSLSVTILNSASSPHPIVPQEADMLALFCVMAEQIKIEQGAQTQQMMNEQRVSRVSFASAMGLMLMPASVHAETLRSLADSLNVRPDLQTLSQEYPDSKELCSEILSLIPA